MIYPSDLETRLGFDQIRSRLDAYCLGPAGKSKVRGMSFLTDPEEIGLNLRQVQECLQMKERGHDLPLAAYADPEPWLEMAMVEGSFLEGTHFLELSKGVQMAIQASQFLGGQDQFYPTLKKAAVKHPSWSPLTEAIRRKIDDDGKVRDSASPALGRIRQRLAEEERKVRRVADQALRNALEHGWCSPGAQVTVRDGRLVIPVMAEHKRRLKGYIVDQSSTGQTFFLEPGEVVEAHNELRDLELEERSEVIRILRELTDALRGEVSGIHMAFSLVGLLDFVRAKARLAGDLDAIVPTVHPAPALDWKEARHPLLFFTLKGKRPLVPLTISLLPESKFLLVSGPNAGGKSVCLKTVGIIQYMFQCGLPVPAREDSVHGIFSNMFLDIGDQQSIENDLSTYSSHLRNMNLFVRESGSKTLILMDELGAGTDPNFGGGIAQAVLQALISRGAWGVATTHYYNLKVFAGNHPGIRNAAMEFDTKDLRPLFRLTIGQPGSSFALEIAGKSGLPASTLEAARGIIGKELTGLETLMKQVAEEKQKQDSREHELQELETKLTEALRHYRELSGKLESQKKEILNKAKSEASSLLQQTNREIEKTIRHIRENKAERQETKKVREGLKALKDKVKPVITPLPPKPVGPIKVGDAVRMLDGEVTGTVLSLKGKTAVVQFGDLRSTLKMDQLIHSSAQHTQKPRSQAIASTHIRERQSSFSPLLDIRGMRVEEVMKLLERFMDDALLTGQHEVKILHGKGEGVLRKVVREYLAGLRQVESVRDEHADRGGEGMTIVVLK